MKPRGKTFRAGISEIPDPGLFFVSAGGVGGGGGRLLLSEWLIYSGRAHLKRKGVGSV
jgi:hypothetical protein